MFAAHVPAWFESFGLQVSAGSPFAARSLFKAVRSAALYGSLGGLLEVFAKPHDDRPSAMRSVTTTAADRLLRNLFARMPVSPSPTYVCSGFIGTLAPES